MAVMIRPDGSFSEVVLSSGPALDKQVHDVVGGWFEVIGLSDGVYMVYDESGKRKHSPRNEQATSFARHVLPSGDYIAGVAFVVSRCELGV